jgi:peroxiredoxin
MVDVGDQAPDFTVPMAGGSAYNDLAEFTLSEALSDGPVVLAFFPAAFTSGCTEEMCTFRDSMAGFDELHAQVYGVSVDLPFAQNIWIEQESLNFPMLSDWGHEVIHAYDVVYPDLYGSIEAAQRSIFVVDTDGIVTYTWLSGDERPDFDEVIADTQAAVAEIAA